MRLEIPHTKALRLVAILGRLQSFDDPTDIADDPFQQAAIEADSEVVAWLLGELEELLT